MNTAFLQRYEAGASHLHRLDARVKIISALLLIIGIVLTPEGAWIAYPLLWTLLGSLAAGNGLSAWRLGRLAGFALPFTLAAVTLLVTTPGHPIVTAAGLTVTDTGLARFLAIVFKSWLSMQVALLFAITTPFTDLLWALDCLYVPETLVTIVSFMYRYLFTIKDEAEKLMRARAARSGAVVGSKSGGRLLWRVQIAGGMVGNLFLRSYERSERVYAAMLARGYRGQMRRQEKPSLSWKSSCQGTLPVMVVLMIQVAVRLL